MLAFTGCKGKGTPAVQTPVQPVVKPAPPTPLDVKKAELGGTTWQPEWDAVVEKALPADLLNGQTARAVRMYCPRFNEETEAERRQFWAYTFQAIAAAEAGLNPTSDVHHLQAAVNTIDASNDCRIVSFVYEAGEIVATLRVDGSGVDVRKVSVLAECSDRACAKAKTEVGYSAFPPAPAT